MRFLIILISTILFNNCTENSIDMQIYFYKSGSKLMLENSKLNLNYIESLLNSVISNTDEILRLYIDAERFETLKKEEICAEFIFSKEVKFKSVKLGELNFNRLLIPFTGDFAGNENSSNIALFIGINNYFPEPHSSSKGYSDVLKLKSELEKALK